MSAERCAISLLVFAGSARKESYNARLARLAENVVRSNGGSVDPACLTDFEAPHYDQDFEQEAGIPEGIRHFGERLSAADGLILASPEYNASMPGALKNLIDWASRIRPQPFNGKQALLLSASPSMVGGNRGLWSLRVPLEHLGMRVYPDMFSLAQAHKTLDGGGFTEPRLQERFESTIRCFIDLVEAAKHYPAVRKNWIEFLGEAPDPEIDRVEAAELE
jgi:chromate reductase, NAD(P)H dehydrogenase (quinone)